MGGHKGPPKIFDYVFIGSGDGRGETRGRLYATRAGHDAALFDRHISHADLTGSHVYLNEVLISELLIVDRDEIL
ncbi:MAG TPA: hypothetical protein VIB00_01525 [Pyrinomonadaceae bacterium]|jgi:hypothetical protein